MSLAIKGSIIKNIVKGSVFGFVIGGLLGIGAYIYAHHGYSKSAKFNNLTFNYSDEKEENSVKTIQSKMPEYIQLAEKIIGEKNSVEHVTVQLKNNKLAKKDSELSGGTNGYYSYNFIVLRSEKYVSEVPLGNVTVKYDPPDIVQSFFHEYTHHLIRDYGLPRWFQEGLAQYISLQYIGAERKPVRSVIFEGVAEDRNWEDSDGGTLTQSSEVYLNRIVLKWGEESISKIIAESKKEKNFTNTLENVLGMPYLDLVKLLNKSGV